jgi:AcrR family transcriptional regulator
LSEAAGPTAQRLRPGRHNLPRELVRENQRLRLTRAAAETLAEQGYGAITVTRVAKRAGVSTGTLYQRFDGLWGCLLAAYETGSDRLCAEIERACSEQGAAAAIDRGLSLLSAEPALASLLFATPPTHAAALGNARLRLAERLATLLRSARGENGGAGRRELPSIAGAVALISMRLWAEGAGRLEDLGPTLTQILLDPGAGQGYAGAASSPNSAASSS